MNLTAIIPALLAAFITWFVSDAVNGLRTASLKAEHAKQIEAERQTCQANQKKTQEVSNALQKRLKDTSTRHADYVSRLLKHEAVRSAGAASRHDAAAGSDRLPDADGQLLGLAATCERHTSQLIACQEFVRKERD